MSFHPFAGMSDGDAASRPRSPLSLSATSLAGDAWPLSLVCRPSLASFVGATRSTMNATAKSPSVAAISEAPREPPCLRPPAILLMSISGKVTALSDLEFLVGRPRRHPTCLQLCRPGGGHFE